jgi:8-oxo-dGTP pyrophosphatase MutT (NUDIX family)
MSIPPTFDQVSAGGVAFRQIEGRTEIALICVGEQNRWQLPKGVIEKDEPTETAALREVREETNVEAEVLALIDTVEYWFYSMRRGERVRYHKFVHFYLMRATSSDIRGQAFETNEARWFDIDDAIRMLAFDGEKNVTRKAKDMIAALPI